MVNDAEYDHVNRKLRTLEQCALYRRTIEVMCRRCSRIKRFDAVALWWLFQRRGWDGSLRDAAKRFRCSSCPRTGFSDAIRLQITRGRLDEDQPPYPDAATWKRLVARYRS